MQKFDLIHPSNAQWKTMAIYSQPMRWMINIVMVTAKSNIVGRNIHIVFHWWASMVWILWSPRTWWKLIWLQASWSLWQKDQNPPKNWIHFYLLLKLTCDLSGKVAQPINSARVVWSDAVCFIKVVDYCNTNSFQKNLCLHDGHVFSEEKRTFEY